MAKWQYLTIVIEFDKKQLNWVIGQAGQPSLVGLQAILESYGAQGWEMVSLQQEVSRVVAGWGGWWIEPNAYRATFKRATGS